MRLIDADALKAELGGQRLDHDFCICGDESTARDFIDDAPKIDAELVKRGKWIDANAENHDLRDKWVRCSCCGYNTTTGFASEYHYCPNCGAKMDED